MSGILKIHGIKILLHFQYSIILPEEGVGADVVVVGRDGEQDVIQFPYPEDV